MKPLVPQLCRLTLALTALLPLTAQAGSDDDLIAAREVFRKNNSAALASYADSLPADYPLRQYPSYWLAWQALERQNDGPVIAFLNSAREGSMPERIRNEWVKKLGKREDWSTFGNEWKKLPEDGRDEESSCYGQLYSLRQGGTPANLNRFLDSRSVPEGCSRLISAAAQKGLVDSNWLWRRTRLLLAGGYVSAARQTAAAGNLPLDTADLNKPASANLATPSGQEAMTYDVVRKAKSDINGAAVELRAVEASLGKERAGFAWGQLALQSAKRLQMPQALQWFEKADLAQLTTEQWEWWTRSALRTRQWQEVERITRLMPAEVADKPAWQYWRARSLKQLGRTSEATSLFVKASQGHHYYALLSLEEIGNSLSTPASRINPDEATINRLQNQPGIRRALALFNLSERYRKPEFRTDAQREWRWSMRGRRDADLLAAAELARRQGFYDMAIYSAERTQTDHDFSLRYLTPYREVTQRYAKQLGIDDAWVYGLIRQESRFITMARSGVGASGLMQLMPATAHWVARKMGLGNSFAVHDIDTNVQLGTWYLRYVLNNLSGNMVMATAAYNAGPARARAWQDSNLLEGSIYAETIPFSETRDYVQKVMANAAYYASTFGHGNISLKTRMGTIPPR